MKLEEKQPRGKPKTRWIDQIRNYIEIGGENWEEIHENGKWKNRDS